LAFGKVEFVAISKPIGRSPGKIASRKSQITNFKLQFRNAGIRLSST
jgi:hypothetical protein